MHLKDMNLLLPPPLPPLQIEKTVRNLGTSEAGAVLGRPLAAF